MSNRIREEFLQAKESVRLNKYLSEAGVCSRREADRLIGGADCQSRKKNSVKAR